LAALKEKISGLLGSVKSGKTLFNLRKDLLAAITTLENELESIVVVDVRNSRRKSIKETVRVVKFRPHMSWTELKSEGIIDAAFGYWNDLFRGVFCQRVEGIIKNLLEGLSGQPREILMGVIEGTGSVDVAKGVWSGEEKEGSGLDLRFEETLVEIQDDLAGLVMIDARLRKGGSVESLRTSVIERSSVVSTAEDLFYIERCVNFINV
jgi:hypothetical protein